MPETNIELKNAADSIMDVVAYLPTGEEYLIDTSIRNPLANRYAQAAFSTAGFAADCGEADKRKRYPATSGKQVVPCVIESFGRLGSTLSHLIDVVAHKGAKY